MRGFVLLVCLSLLAGTGCSTKMVKPTAASEASHRAAAEHLLAAAHARQTLEQSMERMIDIQIRQQPKLAPFRGVMLKFTRKYMSYDSIKDQLVTMYVREFSEKELNQIAAFYETPTGRKAIRVMPKLMGEGAQIGLQRFRAHIGELREMIRAKALELQRQAEQRNQGARPQN